MADFNLWSKESLVRFAEEASARLLAQEDLITELRVSLNRLEVTILLASPVATDTLTHADRAPLDERLRGAGAGRRGD